MLKSLVLAAFAISSLSTVARADGPFEPFAGSYRVVNCTVVESKGGTPCWFGRLSISQDPGQSTLLLTLHAFIGSRAHYVLEDHTSARTRTEVSGIGGVASVRQIDVIGPAGPTEMRLVSWVSVRRTASGGFHGLYRFHAENNSVSGPSDQIFEMDLVKE